MFDGSKVRDWNNASLPRIGGLSTGHVRSDSWMEVSRNGADDIVTTLSRVMRAGDEGNSLTSTLIQPSG